MSCTRNFTGKEVRGFVEDIILTCSDEFQIPVTYGFFHDMCDGETSYDNFNPVGSRFYSGMTVRIGTRIIDENAVDGYVRDEDAVFCMLQGCHEMMHVWQFGVGFMRRDSSNMVKDAARDFVLSRCFDEYYSLEYSAQRFELMAEAYAAEQLKSIFETHGNTDPRFCEVDFDGILCADAKRRYGLAYDVFDGCHTVDDVIDAYYVAIDDAAERTKMKDIFIYCDGLDDRSAFSCEYRDLRDDDAMYQKLVRCSNGHDETELLLRYVAEKHPEQFNGAVCIRDDYVHGVKSRAMAKLKHIVEADRCVSPNVFCDAERGAVQDQEDAGYDP